MNTKTPLLLGVLAVQLLIAAWVFFGGRSSAEPPAEFISATAADVTAIVLQDAQDNKVELRKSGDGWQVGGFPADSDKIESVLAKLTDMAAAWPVATTADAQTRFEVTEDNFQRRIQLLQADTLVADVLLGTSPGFRRVHARELTEGGADSDAVFSIDFANHEVPLGTDDWLDRGLLSISDEIVELDWQDNWSLRKSLEDNPAILWQLGDEAADVEAVGALVKRFADLQVLGSVIEDAELKATFQLATRTADGSGSSYTYKLYHHSEKDRYHMERSGTEGKFEVAGYIAEQLMADKTSLEEKPAEAGEDAAGDDVSADALTEELINQALENLPSAAEK